MQVYEHIIQEIENCEFGYGVCASCPGRCLINLKIEMNKKKKYIEAVEAKINPIGSPIEQIYIDFKEDVQKIQQVINCYPNGYKWDSTGYKEESNSKLLNETCKICKYKKSYEYCFYDMFGDDSCVCGDFVIKKGITNAK